MNILVSSNEKYLKPVMVALYSLSLNTNENLIEVYFINVSVDNKKMEHFKKTMEKKIKKVKINIINIDYKKINIFQIKEHFSLETYSRLLLMDVIPERINRILWLDADIIVHKNIDEFYNMDFENNALIACESINQNDEENKKSLLFNDKQLYFNAGVILFNLQYLREKYDNDYLMNYAIKNNGKLKWLDQDVLNGTLGKESKVINYQKYNYMHFSGTKFSKEEKKYLNQENCIIHYIGPIKPWNFRFDCWTYVFWKQYAEKSRLYTKIFFWNNFILHKIYKFKIKKLRRT